MEYSRRDFVKGAVATGALAASGLALAGCNDSAGATSNESDITWDYEADLVVVGLGAAGASTAYHACKDSDATVIVLEKLEEGHHPATEMSGGVVMFTRDAERAANYMKLCAGDIVPEDCTEAWATEAVRIQDYIRELGFEDEFFEFTETGENKSFEDVDSVGTLLLQRELTGTNLWEYMLNSLQQENITILYETPALRLIARDLGENRREILGVEATQNDSSIFIKGRKGVVLTCGGYEFNDQLKQFLPSSPIYFYGNPANTGDGVIMAQEVGAQLWHMNKMLGRGILFYEDINLGFRTVLNPAPYVIVDRHGERYMNEDEQAASSHSVYYNMIQFDTHAGNYPRNPSWWIFDSTRITKPLTDVNFGAVRAGFYDWSADNSKEIEAGWILKAESIEELAELTKTDKDTLQASLAAYDAACDSGVDEFGRKPETLIKLQPPYYVTKLCVGGPSSSGGPQRNAQAQVIDVRGEPIPRLYSAGELGQVVGNLYPAGGGDISEGICFGAIAARNAIALEPWAEEA